MTDVLEYDDIIDKILTDYDSKQTNKEQCKIQIIELLQEKDTLIDSLIDGFKDRAEKSCKKFDESVAIIKRLLQ